MAVSVAVHNLFKDLPKGKVLEDLRKSADHASVGLVCERSSDAAKAAFSEWRERDNIAAFVPDGGPGRDPIWWKVSKWEKAGESGWLKTHDGKEGVSPDRFFTWQALARVDSGKIVMFVNTHCVNGYAKSGPSAPGNQEWRDDKAKRHWNKGHDLMEGFIRDGWPTIVLGGDFNCAWSDRDQPWYPGPKLEDLCRKAVWPDSILTATLTKSSDGEVVGKDTLEGVNSDHPIKILSIQLTP